MNEIPRQKLKEIIGKYGLQIIDEPRRCEALLRDACGKYKREINLLSLAHKERIPADLINIAPGMPPELQYARLVRRLVDNLSLSEDGAQWAVKSWGLALGMDVSLTTVVPGMNLKNMNRQPADRSLETVENLVQNVVRTRLVDARKAVATQPPAKPHRFLLTVGWIGGLVPLVLLGALLLSRAATVSSQPAPSLVVPVLFDTDTPLPPHPGYTAAARLTLPPTPLMGITQVSDSDGMVMVKIESGDFIMGSDLERDDMAFEDEAPQRVVTLDGFWMDKTEVTNSMYARCVKNGACTLPAKTVSNMREKYYGEERYADHPVIYVDWNQAAAYCSWAGRRLPTEAEWEKAARGTDGRLYPWGNDRPDRGRLNFEYNKGDTIEVGSYGTGFSSPYGVLDMSGNVWEWVADWYDEAYYQVSPAQNPEGPTQGKQRVVRGGAWDSGPHLVRATNRGKNDPSDRYNDLGFRCAMDYNGP